MKAALSVNTYQLALYWEVGFTILQQREEEGWGTKVIDRLSRDLKMEFPGMKGISTRNITYMRDFAEAYPEYPFLQQSVAELQSSDNQNDTILQQLVAKLPWGHHIAIFTKLKTREERLFYMRKCAENNWGRDFLKIQIDNELHRRKGAAITNFENTLPDATSDLARDILKSPYMFDFIAMSEKMQEREIEKGLITHLKSFMMELGKGFAYFGNQYNLKVNGDDYFLDLLFYNTHLHCYVVFELKVGEFKPEYAGKLNFYINTVDAQIKGPGDAPTFGVLLCKTRNETVVKFALEGITTPIGVSEYQLADALPKQLKLEMPSIEELEAEIEREYEELKNPSEKKMDRVKELMKKLKQEKLSEKKSNEKAVYLFRNVFKVQGEMFWAEIKKEILPLFQNNRRNWRVENHGFSKYKEAEDQLLKFPTSYEFGFDVDLQGFKQAGVKTFSCSIGFKFYLDQYHYQVQDRNSQSKYIWRKLYHQNPSHEEMMEVVEHYKLDLLDQIENNLLRITEEENG